MSLTFNPDQAVSELSAADRKLAAVIRRAGPFTMRPEPMHSPFIALLRAIVYQQLSGKAAATIYGRVEALFPRRRPTPAKLLEIEDETLRACGLSRAKLAAARDLAARVLDRTVPGLAGLRRMEDAEVVERLTRVRGIGVWSAEMLLIFRLGRPDVLPVTDLGVRKGFARAILKAKDPNALASPEEIRRYAERWRPWRSVASWYMWRVLDG